MKFLPFLVLPCFLTLGATPFTSTSIATGSILPESTDSATMLNASTPTNGTARRGSGRNRGTGRREVLAQVAVVQTTL